jgi:hypothetical protein
VTLIVVGQSSRPPAAAPLPKAPFAVPLPVSPSSSGGGVAAAAPPAGVLPDHVYVPQLGIAAAYVPVGVAHGELTIPGDVHTVGYSTAGASLSAAAGTVLLASHVDYVGQGRGSFYTLSTIRAYADVYVTDARNTLTHWVVTGLADPLKSALDQSIFNRNGVRRLVLVTCGGQVHDGDYDRNIVVTAAPVSP